jgi:hypothetical protein
MNLTYFVVVVVVVGQENKRTENKPKLIVKNRK